VRIVSLLPAATDLVATLGLTGDLVGRTHECDWPPGALDHVPVVTRTALPDGLSSREISAAVGGAHVGSSLYELDPAVLAEAGARLDAVAVAVAGRPRPRVVVLEWLDPVWPVGHWVPEQVAAAGGTEVLGTAGAHTDAVEWDAVVAAAPEVLVLAPCGFPPERTLAELAAITARPGWAHLPAFRLGQVWVVDGPAHFNRPGPRVVRGVEVLAHVLHGAGAVEPGEAVRLPAP
jgi:ABC-type Fe3+-hydroxamate transport system substrate-binding protein